MHCLVTGATGFIGRELCRQLLARGDTVVALSGSGKALPDGTPTVALDLASELPDADLLRGVDVVYHLAGIAHRRARAEDYHRLNYFATVQLADRAAAAGVGCFVFLSSVKAMGTVSGEDERSEQDCQLPGDHYGLSKWQAECELREHHGDGPMALRILRPALVYGNGAGGNLQLLVRWLRLGLPRPPQVGGRSMIALADLVDVLCLVPGERGSDTWIVSDGESYSTRDLYDALRLADGKGRGVAWLPRWMWRLVCRTVDLSRRAPESTWDKLFATERYSNAALLAATGWQPRYRFEDVAPELLPARGTRNR